MIDEYNMQHLNNFNEATRGILPSFRHSTFSYIALKEKDGYVLCKGHLHLDWRPPQSLPSNFDTPLIKAECATLSDLRLGAKELIESLLAGGLQTSMGRFEFPAESGRSHQLHYYASFGQRHSPRDEIVREIHFSIRGDKLTQGLEHRELDSIIKSASMPFRNLAALAQAYRLGSISGSDANIETTSAPVSIFSPKCKVVGKKAYMFVLLPSGLATDQSSITYWLEAPNQVEARGKLEGNALSWSEDADIQTGHVEFEVPPGSIVHCVANYAGVPQHESKFSDPTTSHNPIHAIFKAFDQNCDGCKDVLFRAYKKGNGGNPKSPDAREFETAVGWLFGMLGFNVVQIGATSQTSEAPDMVAFTRDGHVAVIECTTGFLKEDSKLPNLRDRTEKVRLCLAASGFQRLKVLPVVVTQKTANEVSGEAATASKDGIYVIARESLESMLKRSEAPHDSDELFKIAEDSVQEVNEPYALASLEFSRSPKPRIVW